MQIYDEFFARPASKWSQLASLWLNKAILKNYISLTNVDPSTIDILEIGTGKGNIVTATQDLKFRSYTGVEPNLKLAEYCRKSFGVKIYEDSLPSLNCFTPNQFDTTVAVHVLEHSLNPQDAHEWCAEMLRVTKMNGHVVIVCPDISDYGSFFWDSDWSHSYPTTPKRIAQIFNDLGVQVLFSGKLHLGRTGNLSSLIAHITLILIPTKIGDRITKAIFGRPLVSGLKVSLWGMAFVIAQK